MNAKEAAYLRRIIRELVHESNEATLCAQRTTPRLRLAKRRVNEFIYTLTSKEPKNG